MRILPSQSRVMKPKVGSTVSLVMVSAMSCASAMAAHQATAAPPSGSTPMRRPEPAMAATSMTAGRLATYVAMKS